MENPIKMDDLGVPLFLETPIWQELTRYWACQTKDSESSLEKLRDMSAFLAEAFSYIVGLS